VRVTKHFDGGNSEGGGGFADGKLPTLWVTVGGNFNAMLAANNEPYISDYKRPGGVDLTSAGFGGTGSGLTGLAPASTQTMAELMTASGFPSPEEYEKAPKSGFDWQGKLALQLPDSDWMLTAGIRYGRSGRNKLVHGSEIPGTRTKEKLILTKYCDSPFVSNYDICHSGANRKFIDARTAQSEQHAIMDFEAGVNVGIGLFGSNGQGTISGGLRMAQFKSNALSDINSDPEYFFEPTGEYHNVYESRNAEERSFHGVGPEVTWEANQTVWGAPSTGEISLDWGLNAAVLFGRQSMNAKHFTSYCHVNGVSGGRTGCVTALPSHTRVKTTRRTRRKIVPNLGGYIGASARYNNAKLSFGYRADTFFGAMDGGQEAAKDYNRGFYGPYMNVSIGLGG
jgi:hypothetical protein